MAAHRDGRDLARCPALPMALYLCGLGLAMPQSDGGCAHPFDLTAARFLAGVSASIVQKLEIALRSPDHAHGRFSGR